MKLTAFLLQEAFYGCVKETRDSTHRGLATWPGDRRGAGKGPEESTVSFGQGVSGCQGRQHGKGISTSTGEYWGLSVGTQEVLSPSEVPMSSGRNTFNTGDFAWVGKQYGTAFALSFVIHGMGRQALRDWAFTHSPPLCHYQLGPDGHRLPNLG